MVNFIALPLLVSAASVVYGHGTFVAVKGANGMTGRALAVDPAVRYQFSAILSFTDVELIRSLVLALQTSLSSKSQSCCTVAKSPS